MGSISTKYLVVSKSSLLNTFLEPYLVQNYNVWFSFCNTSLEFKNIGHIQVGIGFPKFTKGDESLAVVVQDRHIRARICNTRIANSYHY